MGQEVLRYPFIKFAFKYVDFKGIVHRCWKIDRWGCSLEYVNERRYNPYVNIFLI